MKTITKLALSRIRTKKTRSAVICAAIFLTIVLFMTVVSISVNLLESYELIMCLTTGSDYHGYIRTSAFTLKPEELRDEILKSKYVADAVLVSSDVQYSTEESKAASSSDILCIIEDEDDLTHFFTEITDGSFPQSDDEILVNSMYFPNVRSGDTVTLYYVQNIDGFGRTASADFKVSGIMTSSADRKMQAVLRYSDTLDYAYGFSEQYMVYFVMKNTINLSDKYDSIVHETLSEYWQSDLQRFGALNNAYLEEYVSSTLNPANVFLILFTVAVVFISSFLLIYNIYSIALTHDMQSFGLLNIIGTTHRQMRKMISIQSLILFGATLPFGLTAGHFIGWKILSPLLFASSLANTELEFSFSPWIPVFTILLTLFTLLWSATRPLNRIRALTPISAVDYSPAADLPKRYMRKKNYAKKNVTPNTERLAKFSVSRNRKKTVITAMSMSLSVILFMLVATICDYMIAYTEANLSVTDYIVMPQMTYRSTIVSDESDERIILPDNEYTMPYDIDEGVGLTDEYVSAVESSVYTKKVWRIRTTVAEMPTPEKAISDLRELKSAVPDYSWSPVLQRALEGRIDAAIVGIPDEFFPKLRDSEGECIGEGYEEGWVINQNVRQEFSYFTDGDTVKLGNGSYRVIISYDNAAAYNITGYLSTIGSRPIIYIPESEFTKQFGEGLTHALLVDASEDYYEALRGELEKISGNFTLNIDEEIFNDYNDLYSEWFTVGKEIISVSTKIAGRFDDMETMSQAVHAIRTVGYSLAWMIFLIGALNTVNTTLSSATERKREFAMLEAVGMTDRQIIRMLLTESLYSGGMTVLMTAGVGFPLIAVIVNTAMESMVSLNWLAGAVMLTVCIAVSVLSGMSVFRLTKSDAVVDRIKLE